tara:strand:- start:465 stop:638 length:174 start_codon:yes stop_codon:yes gene_type:complete
MSKKNKIITTLTIMILLMGGLIIAPHIVAALFLGMSVAGVISIVAFIIFKLLGELFD